MKTFLQIAIVLIFAVPGVFAQTTSSGETVIRLKPAPRPQTRGSFLASMPREPAFAPPMSSEARKLIAPNPEDSRKFSDFLKQPKTGMIRLFSQNDCAASSRVIDVSSETCFARSTIMGKGSAYSFREKGYRPRTLADLQLKDNWLIASGYATQGILVSLGDVELSKVTLETDAMRFLISFIPAVSVEEADKQLQKLTEGIHAEKHLYRTLLPAAENTTYVLRSIAYRGNFSRSVTAPGGRIWRIDPIAGDDRVDTIIAFRIVRRDTDNSLTLLWKELERKNSPKLLVKSENKTN